MHIKKHVRLVIIAAFSIILMNCSKEEENKVPIAEIVKPSDNDTIQVGDVLTIRANADDKDGNIAEVRFFVNEIGLGSSTVFPYEYIWDTRDEELGSHVVKVVAKDDKGASAEDEISVFIIGNPSIANAGSNQIFTDGNSTSTVLNANNPEIGHGQGKWTIISGVGGDFEDDTKANTSFTGILCETYILMWKISTKFNSTSDGVTISFQNAPTTALAGEDQFFYNESITTILEANTPENGSGKWSIVSGEGGSFDDNTSPTTTFTGQECTAYVLRWTISTDCSSTIDDVKIEFNNTPTIANAGGDQNYLDETTIVSLSGNTPSAGRGTGRWTIISGEGGSFEDNTDPVTNFSGLACTSYALRWTISTGCSISYDDVSIVFNTTPTKAKAGENQSYYNDGIVSVVLSANSPIQGQGKWTIQSGDGGSFIDETSPTTKFTGQGCSSYILRWTISTECISSYDDVNISFNNTLVNANAGEDQVYTDGTVSTTLNAKLEIGHGDGLWTILRGEGGSFSNDTNPNSTFTGLLHEEYTLQWTITTHCNNTESDDVYIAFRQDGPGSPLVDYDGNTYNTEWFGSQLWMVQNLKVTHFSDGKSISLVVGDLSWKNLPGNFTSSASAYCWYNDNINNKITHGALYTYTAAVNENALFGNQYVQGVCPDGWHLPNNSEWDALATYLGSNSFQTTLSGRRSDFNGSFLDMNVNAYWWSSNKDYGGKGYYRTSNELNRSLSLYSDNGSSVRCVKD